MSQETENGTKSFGVLITEAIADIQVLVRQSIQLAVLELKESGRRALMASLLVVIAITLFLVSGLLLVIALAFGFIALGLPAWLAFVVDALLFITAGGVLLLIAKSNAEKVKAPTNAADSIETSINTITATVTKYSDSI